MLSERCLNIHGEYYTVSNGFISKACGEIQINYSDLLSVEIVKKRSKKIMYTMLFPAGVLAFAWNFESILSVIVIAFLAVITCFIGAIYLFYVRQFVEITSMKGTYRIAVEHKDFEIKSVVADIQKQIRQTVRL